jgi:hypothetical protein
MSLNQLHGRNKEGGLCQRAVYPLLSMVFALFLFGALLLIQLPGIDSILPESRTFFQSCNKFAKLGLPLFISIFWLKKTLIKLLLLFPLSLPCFFIVSTSPVSPFCFVSVCVCFCLFLCGFVCFFLFCLFPLFCLFFLF